MGMWLLLLHIIPIQHEWWDKSGVIFRVRTLQHGRQTPTEGHGSCRLSVWTLAEPLGVLFQARSDNLAPMTRLATAQFTGRSSTHAQQPSSSSPPSTPFTFHPPTSVSFSQSFSSCCFASPSPFLHFYHCWYLEEPSPETYSLSLPENADTLTFLSTLQVPFCAR